MVSDVKVPYVDFLWVINGYDDDQMAGRIVESLHGNYSSSTKDRASLERLVPSFSTKNVKIRYNRSFCVLQNVALIILQIARASKIGGSFNFSKLLFD